MSAYYHSIRSLLGSISFVLPVNNDRMGEKKNFHGSRKHINRFLFFVIALFYLSQPIEVFTIYVKDNFSRCFYIFPKLFFDYGF